MPNDCSAGIAIPILVVDVCPLGKVSTECVLNTKPIPYFNFLAFTTQSDINDTLTASLADARLRIASLETILGNPPVNNTTTVPLTSAQLTLQYPSVPLGFEVQCLGILKVYKKSIIGWIENPITIVL
jgi:hypothetical protein